MSNEYDETISIDETLDLTYLIEEKEKSYFETDITFDEDFDEKDNYNLCSTDGLIFEPEETGEYEIIAGDKELLINVIDRPESVRDVNAARNVLRKGLEKIGQGLAEYTPVETGNSCEAISLSSVAEAGSLEP